MRGARLVPARASSSVQRVPCDLQAKPGLNGVFLSNVNFIPARVRHDGMARQVVAAAGTELARMLDNVRLGKILGAATSQGVDLLASFFSLGLPEDDFGPGPSVLVPPWGMSSSSVCAGATIGFVVGAVNTLAASSAQVDSHGARLDGGLELLLGI